MAVVLFQGYCLQYFLGSFLESRWKSRWNGLCVAVLYAAGLYGISGMFNQVLGTGYNGYREAIWKLALSLCILVVLALCFYKAFRLITVFLVVSILLLLFTRPVVEKRLNESRVKTNVNSMIGKEGRVTETIDNYNQKGIVIINGLEWTARSSRDDLIIPEGSKVVINEIKGVKVFVSLSSTGVADKS